MLPDRVFEISEKDKFNRIMLQNFIFDRLVMYNEPYLIDRHLNRSTFIYSPYIFTISIFFLQDRGLDFGLTVLPCSTPPGVKIFGSAPQFNAKNFSHVFVHGSDYEIPGKTDFCYILRKKIVCM